MYHLIEFSFERIIYIYFIIRFGDRLFLPDKEENIITSIVTIRKN
ncbi:hypothetical protein NSTC745_05457 [Nostoc sp. DSM 114161]|jgi:hypothetical protein